MNPQEFDEEKIRSIITEEIAKQVTFIIQRTVDTPTDDLAVVNRKYVNKYGSILNRPQVSVIGQQYFDTTNGYPIFRNSNNAWVNSVGSVVG